MALIPLESVAKASAPIWLSPTAPLVPRLIAPLVIPLAMLVVSPAWAAPKEVRYKETPLELKEGDRLVVSGLRATVRLIQPTAAKPSVVRARKVLPDKASSAAASKFEALAFSVRRDGNAVVLEAKGPQNKVDVGDWLKAGGPELVLEIEAQGVPTEVSIHSGQVIAQGWKAPLAVSVVDGAVKTSATEGPIRIQVQKGEVKAESHRGRLDVDSYGARINAQNVEGDLRVGNFGGESAISQVKGNVQLKTFAGGTSIAKTTGDVDFTLGRGALSVQELEGALRGQTEAGNVSAAVEGDAEVNIESNQGAVTVKLPQGSGAMVRLQSESGSIATAENIRPAQVNSMKTATGRLSGSGARGTVAVRTKSGAIRVR